jgi:hypothetical protein
MKAAAPAPVVSRVQSGVLFSNCAFCNSAYFTGLAVHFIQIQLYSCRANHTTDITLHEIKLDISFPSAAYIHHTNKCFKLKITYIN